MLGKELTEEEIETIKRATAIMCGGVSGLVPSILTEFMVHLARIDPRGNNQTWVYGLKAFADVLMVIHKLLKE